MLVCVRHLKHAHVHRYHDTGTYGQTTSEQSAGGSQALRASLESNQEFDALGIRRTLYSRKTNIRILMFC